MFKLKNMTKSDILGYWEEKKKIGCKKGKMLEIATYLS